MQASGHIPVLLDETLNALAVRPGGRYVDGTFGRGGHARAILARGGSVLAIDRDEAALAAAPQAENLTVVRGNHGNLLEIAHEHGWNEVDGILLDLGVSSPQLDEAGRGFSFQREGPLDMRMDRSQRLTAAELVNGADEAELAEIFRTLGEEPRARSVARAICRARAERAVKSASGRFETTAQLADFVSALLGRHGAHHPATRVFQALRMAVNDEMGELERALAGGLALLGRGGRFAVITFESLTDRAVKRFFAAHVGREVSLQAGGSRWEGETPRVRAVTRRAVVATQAEEMSNPRSRSAKLRAVERLENERLETERLEEKTR